MGPQVQISTICVKNDTCDQDLDLGPHVRDPGFPGFRPLWDPKMTLF